MKGYKVMGIHTTSPTRNKRQTHAHLDRRVNGEIYGVLKMGFTKDAPRFEYCFMGTQEGVLTFNGIVIDARPKFKGIEVFEGWCLRYCAEYDIKK